MSPFVTSPHWKNNHFLAITRALLGVVLILSTFKVIVWLQEGKPTKREGISPKPPPSQEQKQEKSTQSAFWMDYCNIVATVLPKARSRLSTHKVPTEETYWFFEFAEVSKTCFFTIVVGQVFFTRLNKHLHQNQILSSSISSLTLSLFQKHWLVTLQECNKGIYFTYSIAQAIQLWINFQNGSKFYTYSSVSTIKQTTFIAMDILMLIIHKQLHCSFTSYSFCLLASIFSFFKQLAKAHLKF